MQPVNSAASSSHETGFPRRLGPYVLASYLDEGGMGRVYLALGGAPEGEQLCVLKRFGNPRSRFSPEQVRENQERFRREAEISLLLSHPCIGRTVSHFEDGPESYLVSELIDGMTMDHLVSSLATDGERLAIPLAAHIAAQIARALGYIHDFRGLGLVHRDLTPSNVMLGTSGEVKVIDFGIAKATLTDDSLTRPHVLVGKPLWTAPEVAEGQKVDRRADLYALGLLFWYLLSGQDPEGHLDAPGAVLPPPSTFNPEVSGAIDEIVLRAIHANPSRRFQTAAEFLDTIVPFIPADYDGAKALARQVYRYESALKKEAIAADVDRARPLLATRTPASRGSWKRAAAFIAPFAVLTAVGLWFLSRQEQRRPADGPASPAPPSLPSAPPVPPATPPLPLPRSPRAPPALPPGPTAVAPRPSPPPESTPRRPPQTAPQPGPGELLAAAKDSFDAEDFPEALRLARAAAKRGGGSKAYVLIGSCLALAKDYAGARAAFEHALRLSPNDEQARRLLEKLGGEAPGKTP